MLPGVDIYELKKFPDERGFFSEIFRKDWKKFLCDDQISQVNLSYSYPGIIRAWHKHNLGQIDYFIVLQGSMKICAYDDKIGSDTVGNLDEIVASSEKLQIVRIPGHYWHGTMTLGNIPSLTMYFVNKLYVYEKPDEERRSWNDPSIVYPTTGEPYNWNYPPHK